MRVILFFVILAVGLFVVALCNTAGECSREEEQNGW